MLTVLILLIDFFPFSSAAYFNDRIIEVGADGYLPSEQDVLRSRVRTTGIVENEFEIDGNLFKMFDVCTNERIAQLEKGRSAAGANEESSGVAARDGVALNAAIFFCCVRILFSCDSGGRSAQ